MKPSIDSQESVGHCKGHCPGHTCCQNWRWQEKHGQWRKSAGNGGKSVRHCLEPSTDNKEGVGKSVRHCLEPSTDSKEGVGCFSMSRHSLEPSIDSQEGVERF